MSRLSCRLSLALLAGWLSFCLAGAARAAAPPTQATPVRVGQIIVVGNERTKQDVILRQLPLFPGQILRSSDVREGQRNLARLGIFERPTITVLDNPDNPDSEFADLLVTVQETATGSLTFGLGVNSDSGLCGSIVLNERNFDLMRWPTSLDDLNSGNAFRGAGQEVRLEVVVGTHVPRVSVTFRDPALEQEMANLTSQIRRFLRESWENGPEQPDEVIHVGGQEAKQPPLLDLLKTVREAAESWKPW